MRYLMLIPTLSLLGCATMYKPPQDDNVAQLRLLTPQFGGFASLRMVHYEDGDCNKDQVFGLVSVFSTTKSDPGADIPYSEEYKDVDFVDRIIPGDRALTFAIKGFLANATCIVHFSFDSNAKSIYQVEYGWRDEQCIVMVNELIFDSDQTIKNPVIIEEPNVKCSTGFDGSAI